VEVKVSLDSDLIVYQRFSHVRRKRIMKIQAAAEGCEGNARRASGLVSKRWWLLIMVKRKWEEGVVARKRRCRV